MKTSWGSHHRPSDNSLLSVLRLSQAFGCFIDQHMRPAIVDSGYQEHEETIPLTGLMASLPKLAGGPHSTAEDCGTSVIAGSKRCHNRLVPRTGRTTVVWPRVVAPRFSNTNLLPLDFLHDRQTTTDMSDEFGNRLSSLDLGFNSLVGFAVRSYNSTLFNSPKSQQSRMSWIKTYVAK